MAEPNIDKQPVLFQLPTGLFLGVVCYNTFFESLQFVLEKKEFFEVEWPALVQFDKTGLYPILLGIPTITLQRVHIIWYTLDLPKTLFSLYQQAVPIQLTDPFLPPGPKGGGPKKPEKKETQEKIIPFPFKKEED
ncbi:hypothetical protein F1847_06010 [Thermodesulfobacterium sp. TA1]|uniref:hypothetical protein n=1 Tax=Thermodesulfobacterium sp. TA1 TaxID=2234087 RepID=UPI001232B920|nr:hypothetical protein [Thermodesulfobacterium sp. TA1]QER42317.1 hypothetical protein F1847_06010 [Thermodesulfobacterium sp. TA1]